MSPETWPVPLTVPPQITWRPVLSPLVTGGHRRLPGTTVPCNEAPLYAPTTVRWSLMLLPAGVARPLAGVAGVATGELATGVEVAPELPQATAMMARRMQ